MAINAEVLTSFNKIDEAYIDGLLKKEMHFNGVVVSDAMTMAGFRGWYKNDLEGQVASF